MNPFTPLSELELSNIIQYFKNEIITEPIPENVMFDYVGLYEPIKSEVLYFYETGILPIRKAEVGIYYYYIDKYFSFIVELENEKVSKVSQPNLEEGVRPKFNCPDDLKAEEIVLSNEDFINAMKKRGLSEYDIHNNIGFDISLDGRLYNADNKFIYNFVNENTKFRLKTTVFNTSESKILYETKPRPQVLYITPYWADGNPNSTSFYVNPFADVFVYFDRRTNKVIKVIDNDIIYPIPKGNTDWERPYPLNMKPLVTLLPEGPSYTVNGNVVNWGDWEFTWSFDPVYGVSINNVSFLDRTTWRENPELPPVRRSILYKANLSEVVTAYSDSAQITAQRNFYDIREYPATYFIVSLTKGIDVPNYADLYSVYVSLVGGDVIELTDVIGLYEKDDGMLWKHTDFPCEGDVVTRGRSGRKLVLTTVHSIGNYDYMFNWNFYQDGKISYQINPTGIVSNVPTHITKVNGHDDIEGGTLVRPNVIAVNHCHYANVRLDFAIDGLRNSINEIDLLQVCNSKENPWGNKYVEKETLLETEGQAIRNQNFNTSRAWAIENENSTNYLGYPRSYKLMPFPTPSTILNDNSRISIRAPYMLNNLHVTKYRDGELYASGKYVVENETATGLPQYINKNENIVNEDIVVWYTFGFGHKPDVEQYPVMPKENLEFFIVPDNFFNENPALYIPPTTN